MKRTILLIFLITNTLFSSLSQPDYNQKDIEKYELYFLFGLHAFAQNYHDIFLPRICFQEMFGAEILFKKQNLALDIRRNYWVSFYGGKRNGSLNDLAQYDHIGLKKSFQIRKNTFKIGISHAWIVDPKITKFAKDTISGKVKFYPFRAISPYYVYSIGSFDFELRVYIPYNHNAYTEEYNKFDKSQINLGFVYRWNPVQNKK